MTDRYKLAARELQAFAGIPYQTAHALTHGRMRLRALSPDCAIAEGLALLRADPRTRVANTDTVAPRDCRCAACALEASSGSPGVALEAPPAPRVRPLAEILEGVEILRRRPGA